MSALNTFLRPLQNAANAVQVENLVIPGFIEPMMARLYRPAHEAGTLPGVLYFHGGGFVGGSLDDADIPARFIAEHASVVVLSVAYSLAPARPFPAAPEDAYAASMWLLENSKRLKVDAERLAVAGDDAGGNLAAAMALIARDRNAPDLLAQVLIGPMLNACVRISPRKPVRIVIRNIYRVRWNVCIRMPHRWSRAVCAACRQR